MGEGDPFAALGLPARAGLSDDDVRAAWRRIATATHPDRDDGGDPARFAAAAAAYERLRTSFGRGEAVADLAERGTVTGPRHRRAQPPFERWRHLLTERPARLGAQLLGAAAVVGLSFGAAGWSPGTVGVLVGALTLAAAKGCSLLSHWRHRVQDRAAAARRDLA